MSPAFPQPPSDSRDGSAPATPPVRTSIEPPHFILPEIVGVAMPPDTLATIIQQSLEEIAAALGCPCLVALSYLEPEHLLRGISTVGYCDDEIRAREIRLADFPDADCALQTGQNQVVPNEGLPPLLRDIFKGQAVLMPLLLGERRMALLVGQIGQEIASHSPEWQTLAEESRVRASLVCELLRLATAYQDEMRIRQSNREISAAILEGRPLGEVAALITDIVANRLHVERVGLYLRETTGRFLPLALRNISTEYGEFIKRLPRPGPTVARAIATGLPIFQNNLQADPNVSPELREAYQREGVTSMLAAMLHHDQTMRGVLIVYPVGNRLFTPAELTIFQSFADLATLAVATSQMLSRQRDVAVIEERNRLAREMHDTVAQLLAALVLQLETAQTLLAANDLPNARELLTGSRLLAKRALEDTRRAVQDLTPSELDSRSPGEAIGGEVASWEEETGVSAQFLQTGDEQLLFSEQNTALLRIAQEALSNVRKYAQARRIRVGLNYGIETVTLTVEDDGIGFDTNTPQSPDAVGGYGLFGMTERARLVGGELRLESTPGWGTRIQAILPYRPASPVEGNERGMEGNRRETGDERQETRQGENAPNTQYRTSNTERPIPDPRTLNPEPAARIRVLVVDDHAITRQGVRTMLEASGEIIVVGEANDGAWAVEQARTLQPDVVLMDLQMPGVSGLEGLKRLQAEQPGLPVVVLTTFQTQESVREALSAGARGFLLKDAEPADLVAGVRAAQRGESLLAPTVTDSLSLLAAGQANAQADGISDRDREILQLLAQGARNKEIAARLFLSPKTVEYHLSRVFAKLDVSNRAEAVRAAIERQLIPAKPSPK